MPKLLLIIDNSYCYIAWGPHMTEAQSSMDYFDGGVHRDRSDGDIDLLGVQELQKKRSKALQAKYEVTQVGAVSLLEELAREQKTNRDFTAKIESLSDKLKALKVDNEELAETNKALVETNTDLHDKNRALRLKIDALDATVAQLKTHNLVLMIDDIEGRVGQLEQGKQEVDNATPVRHFTNNLEKALMNMVWPHSRHDPFFLFNLEQMFCFLDDVTNGTVESSKKKVSESTVLLRTFALAFDFELVLILLSNLYCVALRIRTTRRLQTRLRNFPTARGSLSEQSA